MSAVHQLVPIPKDGDGVDSTIDVDSIVIEIASNGYVVTYLLIDGSEFKEIYADSDSLLKAIKVAL